MQHVCDMLKLCKCNTTVFIHVGEGFGVCCSHSSNLLINHLPFQGMEYNGLLWKVKCVRLCQSGLLGRPRNKNDTQFVRTVFMGVFKVTPCTRTTPSSTSGQNKV